MHQTEVKKMSNEKLHPSISEFKGFVKKNPKLIKEVRNGNKSWQELYEDWYLLGEEDESWNKYKLASEKVEDQEEKSNFLTTIFSSLKKVDMNEMEQHISSVSSAIANIQNVLQQFQGTERQKVPQQQIREQHPFSFRKD